MKYQAFKHKIEATDDVMQIKVPDDEDPQDLVPSSFQNGKKLNFRPT